MSVNQHSLGAMADLKPKAWSLAQLPASQNPTKYSRSDNSEKTVGNAINNNSHKSLLANPLQSTSTLHRKRTFEEVMATSDGATANSPPPRPSNTSRASLSYFSFSLNLNYLIALFFSASSSLPYSSDFSCGGG